MRRHLLLSLAASTLVMASVAAVASPAAKFAERAEKALGKKKAAAAVEGAESAVAASPRDAGYRMLLGRAYLEAGRYRSAAASFADALALDRSRGAAALSLALTRIGLGDQDAARQTLDANAPVIPAGDRGLALALAGDPATGVALLEAEVRGGASDAKTRQNLALSYALAGRWPEAKLMASYDLDPATVSQRIMEWSRFTRENQASAQVAALLGVSPVEDAGQPVRLALAPQPASTQMAVAAPPPPAPRPMTEAVAFLPSAPAPAPAVQFAPRAEVVQQVRLRIPEPAAQKAAVVVSRLETRSFARPTGGRFVVQLGAYDSAGVAIAAWSRTAARNPSLRGLMPSTAITVRDGVAFHRLSVAGFGTRNVAAKFCEALQARGAACFVREQAGDAPLPWAGRSGATRLAAR